MINQPIVDELKAIYEALPNVPHDELCRLIVALLENNYLKFSKAARNA